MPGSGGKDVQAKDWVGNAVAKALGLNLNRKTDKTKVKGLIAIWLAAGSLVEVEGRDDNRRDKNLRRSGRGGLRFAPP